MYGLSKGDPCARARAGFGITTEPTFSVSRLAYILAYGGVYAIAGIRCACIPASHACTTGALEHRRLHGGRAGSAYLPYQGA